MTEPEIFIAPFDRANISYTVQVKTDAKRQLLKFLQARRGEAGIIYCLSRKKTESVAAQLCDEGYEALPYHAGLDAAVRRENQRRFLAEEGLIIVATIAFGMGIDKPNVRFVAHFDLPKSMESYYQETGRAGRDGEPSAAWMVYGLQDVVRLRQMLDESEAGEDFKRYERYKLDALLGWCEVTGCRRRPRCSLILATPWVKIAVIVMVAWRRLPPGTGQRPHKSCSRPSIAPGSASAPRTLSTYCSVKKTEKVQQHGHDRLSVFGIGKDKASATWRSVTRQLVVAGHLRADAERYGALVLTDTSRGVLRGEIPLLFREDPKQPAAVARRSNRARVQ